MEPDPIFEFGFRLPDEYVKRTCTWLQRFGVLPDAGGLNDQKKIWVEAAETYFAKRDEQQRLYDKQKPKP